MTYCMEQIQNESMSRDQIKHRRFTVVFNARAKNDLEELYNRLADDAEEDIRHKNLCKVQAYDDIRCMTVVPHHHGTTSSVINKKEDSRCNSAEQILERWCEH